MNFLSVHSGKISDMIKFCFFRHSLKIDTSYVELIKKYLQSVAGVN